MNIDPKDLHNGAVLRAIHRDGPQCPSDHAINDNALAIKVGSEDSKAEWLAFGRIFPELCYKHNSDVEQIRAELLTPEVLMQMPLTQKNTDEFGVETISTKMVAEYVDGWNAYRNRL